MRKLKSTFIIFNLIITIVLVACFTYTKLQVNNVTNPPYKLGTNTICISINKNIQRDSSITEAQILEYFKNILDKNKILLISENINSYGLGVFNLNGYYREFKLTVGEPINHNLRGVLVKQNSYTFNSAKQNQIISNNGKYMSIVGIYDKSYPLNDINKEYIFNFFDDPALCGYYYLYHSSKEKLDYVLKNEIIPLMENGSYDVKIEKTYSKSITSIIKKLFSNSIYMISILIIVFIYINLFFNYKIILSKLKKIINVHLMFGSTKILLTRYITKYYLGSIILGSICGGLFYAFIFNRSKLILPIFFIFLSVLINIIISCILIIIVAYSKCSFIGGDGKKIWKQY